MHKIYRVNQRSDDMKTLAILPFLLLPVIFSSAQNPGIRGRVFDSTGRETVSQATILLMSQKGNVIRSGISDNSGSYLLPGLSAGTYHLQVRHTAYTPFQSPAFTISDTSVIFSDIYLVRASHQLESVTIRAARNPVTPHPDGYIYDAKSDIPVAGEKAADVLRKLPGVMISPDGSPVINSSPRIKVFIDGKPSELFANSVADALNQIPSENIVTIKVISHPSARYEAEGVTGVIEISTRQPSQNATSGTLNSTFANRTHYLNSNLLLRRGRWITGIDAGLNRLDLEVAAKNHREGSGLLLRQERYSNIHRNNEFGGVTFTFLADSLTTFYTGYRVARYHDDLRHRYINHMPSGETWIRTANNPLRRWLHSANAGFTKRSGKTEFSILAAGFYRPANDSYRVVQYAAGEENYRELSENTSLIREFTFQTDLSKELQNKHKIELGGRYNYRNLASRSDFDTYDFDSGAYIPDELRSALFRFRSSISALYLNYAFDLGPHKVRTGLRYEYTSMQLEANRTRVGIPKYGNLLPNLLISRSFSQAGVLSASYARRIQRPYMVYLNPVVSNYMDSLNIEYGNPDLKPVILHHFLLTHTYTRRRSTLSSSVFINHSAGNIEYVRMLRPGGTTESTWLNISSHAAYGASLNFSFQGKRFSFRINNTLQSVHFNAGNTLLMMNNGLPSQRGLIFSNGGYFSCKLNKGYTLTSYTSFNTRSVSLQGYSTGVQWYNIILSKNFLENKLNTAIRIDNAFTRYQYITERTHTPSFTQEAQTRNIYRFFRVSISYKWGKKEVRLPQQKNISGEM